MFGETEQHVSEDKKEIFMNNLREIGVSLIFVLCIGQAQASVISNNTSYNKVIKTQTALPRETSMPKYLESINQQCMDYIQGNISWLAAPASNKTWATVNLRKLCAGATDSYVPGKCFKYVLHGQKKWDKQKKHKLDWRDGLALCAGARQFSRIEKCFKTKISIGKSVRESALGCNQKYFDKKDAIVRANTGSVSQNFCSYPSAQALMRSCPSQAQIQKIRSDFNISFDNDLVNNNVLTSWNCTEGGDESSIMLTMYNTYRLAQCIPFDRDFRWASGHDNLYDWLKSVNIRNVNYFWADSDTDYSHANGTRRVIALRGNNLGSEIYRSVINPRSGVGAIHALILLVHEAAHISQNKSHNCDSTKDSSLFYMGAWGVQYYLNKMLAYSTGDYFSEYEKRNFASEAQRVRDIRICDTNNN